MSNSEPVPDRPVDDDLVTVCSACLKASCWNGIFMCDGSSHAGTVDKRVGELRTLDLEHPDYWVPRYWRGGKKRNGGLPDEAVPVTPDETRGVDLDAVMAMHAAYLEAFNRTDLTNAAWCSAVAVESVDCAGLVPDLVAEVRVLRDQRDKALDEHVESGGTCSACTDWGDNPADWPCPTVAALTGKDTER